MEKKKIIKKVRFFDAESGGEVAEDLPKVGSKRKLQSNANFLVDEGEEDEDQ